MQKLKLVRRVSQGAALFIAMSYIFGAMAATEQVINECHAAGYRIDGDKTLGSAGERARLLEQQSAKCASTGAYDVFLATLYQESGAFDDADRAARIGLKVGNAYQPNLLHALARNQFGRGNVSEAYQMGLDVAQKFPKYSPIYGLIIGIDSKLKHWDKAHEHTKQLLKVEPSAASYFLLGTTSYQLQRFTETVAAVNRALELEPQRIASSTGVVEGIYSLIYLNRREEAIDLITRHIQANRNWRQNAHMVKAARELGLMQ